MPHLSNCEHHDTGWCLGCVRELYEQNEADRDRLNQLESYLLHHDVYAYESVAGPRYRLAGKYDNHIKLWPTLREAIDAAML